MFITRLASSIFGSRNQRLVKRMRKVVKRINLLEPELQALSDDALKAKAATLRALVAEGRSLASVLEETFALVREASRRVLSMRHFDVQLIGGMVLHDGKIAEMHTGEGKTLVATLPACLNALTGKGVHVVTVNDYLAQRDAAWMQPIYDFLGFSVGVVIANMDPEDKKKAYQADIIYGTNNEFGFDYLRDNMAFSLHTRVQRPLHYAIVDEVDSILIDEARTPLIISGPTEDSPALYQQVNALIPQLKRQQQESEPGDYTVDEKTRQAFLTEDGHQRVEGLLQQAGLLAEEDSLYSSANVALLHHLTAALRAHALFQRDVDYIVRDDEVIIVDEHTGRTMPGRRWSEGLHQAVEAKEQVTIQNENQTLASITFQNYFRLYDKLAGMTGTADTEAYEFQQIYQLEVVVIPPNRPSQRLDAADLIFLTQQEKYDALIDEIKQAHKARQPVLLGTASIETSEYLSGLLNKAGISHNVLNAKFHQQEAGIISEAGRLGAVTIATNMAGRGTDIVLGGNLEAELARLDDPTPEVAAALKADWQTRHDAVIKAGGLCVVGSERHESRRIDNQLRGRSGRQGDPGRTRFYLSLEDNLMRIFAPAGLKGIMQKLGMEAGQAIESRMVSRAIENAQRKVESHHFDVRKQLLEYDNVANEQRRAVYERRDELLSADDVSEDIEGMLSDVVEQCISLHIPPQSLDEQWQIEPLTAQLRADFAVDLSVAQWLEDDHTLDEVGLRQRITEAVQQRYQARRQEVGDVMPQFEKTVMLQTLDMHWKEHLAAMDYLRQGINLRGYAQKDPRQEYKREAFALFTEMLERVKYEIISTLATFELSTDNDITMMTHQQAASFEGLEYQHAPMEALPEPAVDGQGAVVPEMTLEDDDEVAVAERPYVRAHPKLGRNEVCFCGSGKKYKHCHGRIA